MVHRIIGGDLIKSWVLAVQLFFSFGLSVITLVKSAQLNSLGLNDTVPFNSSASSEAIASLVFFSIGVIAYIAGAVACGCYVCHKRDKCKPILTAIGGLFYYIGDNLPPLIEEYEHQLSCGRGCVEGIQHFGIVMLALAAITYLPIMVSGEVQSEDEEQDKKPCFHANIFQLLSKITDLDLVYTTIERIISSNCPDERAVVGAWLYYSFFIAAFSVLLFGTLTIDICRRKISPWPDFTCGLFHSTLIFVCLACYLLVDNTLPLACSGLARENPLVQSIVRCVIWVPPLLIALYGACYWFCAWKYNSPE